MSTPVPTSAHTVLLQNYVLETHGLDLSSSTSGTFAVKDIPIPNALPEDSLLVQIFYPSNDPYPHFFLENSTKFDREYLATLPLGTPFPSLAALDRIVQIGGNETDGLHKVGNIIEVLQQILSS